MIRNIEILKYLSSSDKYITIEELANIFSVSTRTIRTDLDILSDFLSETKIKLIKNRNLGVFLDTSRINSVEFQNLLTKISKEDDFYIGTNKGDAVLCYIFKNPDIFTISDIMDEVGISKNTAIKEIEKCETFLNAYEIEFIRKRHYGINLKYSEKNFRNCITSFICQHNNSFNYSKFYKEESNVEYVSDNQHINSLINFYTDKVNELTIKKLIFDFEKECGAQFTDDAFANLFIYICISISRYNNGFQINDEHVDNLFLKSEDVKWINHNISKYIDNNDFVNNIVEIQNISSRFISNARIYNSNSYADIDSDVENTVSIFIERVERYLCIDLEKDETLFKNLLMHIKPAIYRFVFGDFVQNPLVSNIEALYPEVMKACEVASEVFVEKYNKMPNKDEISFLAMHIAVAIEKKRKKQENFGFVKVIVACSSGIATSNMLAERLLTEFPNILIDKIASIKEIENIDKTNIDLIISTAQMPIETRESVITVSPLLKQEDINKIKTFISKKSINNNDLLIEDLMSIIAHDANIEDYSKLKNRLISYFSKTEDEYIEDMPRLWELIDDDSIELNVKRSSKQNVIENQVKLLVKNNLIEKGFKDKLNSSINLLKDALVISPGIAFPHAKDYETVKKTCVCFTTLEKPIDFGNQDFDPVWLIVTLCVKNAHIHLKALSDFMELINRDDIQEELKRCKDPQKIKSILRKVDNE